MSPPPPGHVQLTLYGKELYLNIPLVIIRSCCAKPFRYLCYVGWCILGALGVLKDSGGNAVSLDEENINEQTVYEYWTHTGLQHAIDPKVVQLCSNSVPMTETEVHEEFRGLLSERDGYCVWTGAPADVSHGMHLIPFARGDEWFRLIVANRLHEGDEGEDLEGITINDIRNGIIGNSVIHQLFDRRDVAILKTPNPILECHHIPMHQRKLRESTSYPDGARYTLQLINTNYDDDYIRVTVPHNSDAAFVDHDLPKPSDVVLHYMYGAVMLERFGVDDCKDVLRTRAGVPRPDPLPDVSTRMVKDRPMTEKEQRAFEAEAIVLHFWSNSQAARERRAKKEAELKERLENWRSGVS